MIVNLPWTRILADHRGDQWLFEYRGGSVIKIRPHTSRPGDWTNTIDLNYENKAPGDVTAVWLNRRARTWIRTRNADLVAGNL